MIQDKKALERIMSAKEADEIVEIIKEKENGK